MIMARPLRKSLAEHIQFFGRGLRISPETGKVDCLVLDHSGNCARFWAECNGVFEFGVSELDDGTPSSKAKPRPRDDAEMVKCPNCRHLHIARAVLPAVRLRVPPAPIRGPRTRHAQGVGGQR